MAGGIGKSPSVLKSLCKTRKACESKGNNQRTKRENRRSERTKDDMKDNLVKNPYAKKSEIKRKGRVKN